MKTLVSRYSKEMIAQLPKVQFQGRIIVIQSKEEAIKAVDYLLKHKIIGIDTETKPVFKKGMGMNPVALLQVSTKDTCFLFRLNRIGFTDDLVHLMGDKNVLKVGLSLKDDFIQLNRRKAFDAGCYAELQSLVKEMGIMDQSLQKIYANFFNLRISKSQQLSNWEADILTEAQKIYAATDAWACVQLYEEIMHLNECGYMLDIIPEPEQQTLNNSLINEDTPQKSKMQMKKPKKRIYKDNAQKKERQSKVEPTK